jgi:hypothetical protein
MGSFKNRSDYFKSICNNNILIADGRSITGGGLRKSYFRINNEDEFDAACENWIHFPCCVYIDYSFKYKDVFPGYLRKVITNELWFLAKIDKDQSPLIADAMENAYDLALQAMDQFVSWIDKEMREGRVCGEIFHFYEDQTKVERLDILSNNLTGWRLIFQDEKQKAVVYNGSEWFNGDASDDQTGGGGTVIVVNDNDAEVIQFTAAELTKPIDWSVGGSYRTRFGKFPEIEVWTAEGMIDTVINVDAPYPDTTLITVKLPGVDGWIVLK